MKTWMLYSSYNGQTHKIACAIAPHLTNCCECDVVDLRLALDLDLQLYKRVVIGAEIRYGRFAADLDHFNRAAA